MSKSHEDKIRDLLTESSSDASRIGVIHPPMSAIIDEIVTYCISCTDSAETVGEQRFVPVSRIQHLQAWAERKKAELVELSLIKQGEVIAYKKALETLSERE